MRISDWSSDVCSSDLDEPVIGLDLSVAAVAGGVGGRAVDGGDRRHGSIILRTIRFPTRYDRDMARHAQLELDLQLRFPLYAASRALTRAYAPPLGAHDLTSPQYLPERKAHPLNPS